MYTKFIPYVIVFITFRMSVTNCASYRRSNDLESKIDQIQVPMRDLISQINKDTLKIDEILRLAQDTNKYFTDLSHHLGELQKRTEIWSTHEHFITSWLDQISAMERKLDIIIKAQERITKVETQINEIQQDIAKIDIDRFEEFVTKAEKTQINQTTNPCSNNNLFSLIDEYTTRGVLSTLNRIESELKMATKEQLSSNCSRMNSIVEVLDNVSAKVDVIVDKLAEAKTEKQSEANRTLIDYETFYSEPVTDDFEAIMNTTSSSINCLKYREWTTVQARSPPSHGDTRNEHVNKTWSEYKDGFITKTAFWLGLKNLEEASVCDLRLRIELHDFEGNFAWAEYNHFKVLNESTHYTLQIGGYDGNATDSFISHNNVPFSTYDRNNDNAPECCPCAVTYGSGWWFNSCFETNLNGKYTDNPYDIDYYDGIIWEGWLGNYSLQNVEMKIKGRL